MKRAVLAVVLVACVNSRNDERDAGAATAALSVEDCETILRDAEKKVAEARSLASVQCKTDADCTLVPSTACIPGCTDRPIAKSALPAYESVREAVRADACQKWTRADCAKTTPKTAPACDARKVACTDGKCVATGS